MKKGIALACMLFVGVISFGQTLNLEWSEKFEYDKEEGFVNQLIGESDKYVYANIYDFKTKLLDDNSKLKIKCKLIAYNKTTKKVELSANLMGFPDTKSSEKVYSNLEYYKSVIQNNIIYVFWYSQQTVSMLISELHCQTFDLTLKPLQPLKKICELPCSVDKVKDPAFIICTNPTRENIIIVGESFATDATQNKNYKIEVRTINANLAISKNINLEVPYKSEANLSLPICGEYSQLNDGNLFVKSQKNYIIINPTSNKKLIVGNKIEGRLIMSLKSYTENNITKYIGTYITKETENISEKKSGIFTFEIDEAIFKPTKTQFIEFNQEQLTILYPKLEKNSTSDNTMNYEIDELISLNNKLYLFASKTVLQYNSYGNNQTGSGTSACFYKDQIVPIVFSNNKIEKLLTPIKRSTVLLDVLKSDDIISLNSDKYVYLIFDWDYDNKRVFGIGNDGNEIEMKQNRLYYWVTNIETGQTEIKYLQVNNKKLSNYQEKYIKQKYSSLLRKWYGISENTEFYNSENIYFMGLSELSIVGNEDKKPKYIGQLSITK
jgi:hypothetical protein